MQVKEFKSPTSKIIHIVTTKPPRTVRLGSEWRKLKEDMWSAAYAAGAISKDMGGSFLTPEENVAKMRGETEKFHEELKEYLRELLDEGDPEKLDGYGYPKMDYLKEFANGRPVDARIRKRLVKEIRSETE